ncbi:MAG: tetratricopeptide repeat protein [Alcanivoracaceae bacterium]
MSGVTHSIRPRSRPSLRRSLLAAAVALAACAAIPTQGSLLIIGDDLPVEPMPLDLETRRYLAFNESTFAFYADRQFEAMTQLLANQKRGLFNDDTEYAELMLGELYVNFGLADQAEAIFNRLLKKDILAQLRAETWLHKAALHYRRGQMKEAADILASRRTDGLPSDKNARRHLMLANIRIGQEEFGDALSSLHAIPSGTREGAYATYNMGVAMIRANHVDDGVRMLSGVLNLPPGDDEINALKDRAALAIGLTELKRKRFDTARTALVSVRADGPFSNEALLALGLSNFERRDFRRALPLWLELVRRNPSHESVQEALLMAPRAYEELGAMPQALAGYRFAAETLRDELRQVELAIRNVDQENWLDRMKSHDKIANMNRDPMSTASSYSADAGPEMPYLYRLFASHDFSEQFRQYMELDRLHEMLAEWRDAVPAMQQAWTNQQASLQTALPKARAELVSLRRQQEQHGAAAADLLVNIPQRLDMKRPQDLADFDQLLRWEMITALDEHLARQPAAAQRERLRRVRGVLLFDIASAAPQNRRQQQRDVALTVEEIDIVGVRIAAVEQLIRDASLHIRSDIGGKLGQRRTEIDRMITETERLMAQLGQLLKNDALRVLAQNRIQLGEQLAEAHLAMARVQDSSFSERLQGGER